MWVYQRRQNPEPFGVFESEKNSKENFEHGSSIKNELALPSTPAPVLMQPMQKQSAKKKRLFAPSRDCILLAVAYLFGTFAAGLLQVRCDVSEGDILSYYIQCWRQLFDVQSIGQVVRLFWIEFATFFSALTAFLLLGLSALGPLPIYLLAMFYGIGTGLLSTQLFLISEPLQIPMIVIAFFSGIPIAVSVGMLCLFGASAIGVSNRLHSYSFGREEQSGSLFSGASILLGQFSIVGIASLPLCGAAVCFAYLSSQIL